MNRKYDRKHGSPAARYPVRELAICGVFIAAAFAVFGQTVAHQFVAFDDNVYVYENRDVRKGLSPAGIGWAFTHIHAANWHPLTTVTHMLDCSLYALRPAGHHFGNVLLHAMATVALFLALRRLTGAVWRSAIVAAAFCLHPLHVESVAWVAERKDVLSGLFFGLTLWAYADYAARPFSGVRYAIVLALFALGLLSKPMLVTLPFLLLLLDYWPLRRIADGGWLIVEKLPLIALSATSCIVTYLVQSSSGAVSEAGTTNERIQTALWAYTAYLLKAVWPVSLATPYPRIEHIAAASTLASALVLAGITVSVVVLARRGFAYLAVGWFWFLGMLVPVVGFVVIGDQSMADRYTYLPLIGIFMAVVWGGSDLLGPRKAVWGIAAATAILTVWAALSFRQATFWRDSETLLRHAIAATDGNPLAQTNLGIVLKTKGQKKEAMECFRAALAIRPTYYLALHNLGIALSEEGDWNGAIENYRASLASRPNNALAHNNLGFALASIDRMSEAQQHFEEALRLDPEHAKAHNNLAIALTGQGRIAEAIEHLRKAVALEPDYAQGHLNLGKALASQGATTEAVAELCLSLKLQPANAETLNALERIQSMPASNR